MTGVLLGEIHSLYLLELQQSKNSIVVLNKEATEFFMQDFNLRTKSLWVSRVGIKCSAVSMSENQSLTPINLINDKNFSKNFKR